MASTLSTPARRFGALVCAILTFGFSAGSREHAHPGRADSPLIVHEWGTFTSIAGADGSAIEWLPLSARYDLPSFVERYRNAPAKAGLRGTIRMETPVLYFYSARETTVSVHVAFHHGLITEWYPHATPAQPPDSSPRKFTVDTETRGGISWNAVSIAPHLVVNLPRESAASHYYAARETSAAPLFVESPTGAQHEKFLFYRGVASFSPPISARILSDNRLALRNRDAHMVPALILFERRGDKLGYRLLPPLVSSAVVDTPSTSGTLDSLRADFEQLLIAQGLYADEAHAMLETWRDSWFEEGSRLFYIVPRSFVDSVLPLSIDPAPMQMTRAFVGRIELITPATQNAVEAALLSGDDRTLEKYDRFLTSIVESISPEDSPSTRDLQLRDSLSSYLARTLPRTLTRFSSTASGDSSRERR